MTEERLVLAELLEKAGEGDFLRAVAEAVLQLLMETDVEGVIGAGRYERLSQVGLLWHLVLAVKSARTSLLRARKVRSLVIAGYILDSRCGKMRSSRAADRPENQPYLEFIKRSDSRMPICYSTGSTRWTPIKNSMKLAELEPWSTP